MNETRIFTLDELSALTDTPKRTVRYYIQRGLLERPMGEKRGAHYLQRHLEQLLEIRKWQAAGLSLERIAELLAGDAGVEPPPPKRKPGDVEVWSHILLADGVELRINPVLAGLSPAQIRKLTEYVMDAVANLEDVK
ncbi:MerR family transcriptional regulator [Microbulbifer guangxiensis]|uniref:MerR family transcriptional regulator n=1 Tax=Microbulbifer guangxiensis TaxID=2904249 RepID=UPI001F17792F|nr:MerR family transcriptional regulator [Microbulbifer guangxiensis]